MAILTGMMLPALTKALWKARGVADHMGGIGGVEMRIDQVISSYTGFRLANPAHGTLSKKAFLHELKLSPEAEAWLYLESVEYRPFSASDPPEQPAIIVHPSSGSGSGPRTIVFRIYDLLEK